MDMNVDSVHLLRLLADPLRWRLLRVAARERLNVGELTRVLGLAQSGVSRHVSLLAGAGLLTEERRGGFTYVAPTPAAPPGLGRLWEALQADLREAEDAHGDDARLAEVLRERAEQGAEDPASPEPAEPGRSWAAWAQALARLVPSQAVVHLGAGRGALTAEVARFASRVLAVEPDRRALAAARAALAHLPHVAVTGEPLAAVGQPDGAFDLALLAQALPTEPEPQPVLREAARLVRPGGRVLVMDLLPHRETWVLPRLGHQRLGVSAATLARWLRAAGLVDVRLEPAARRRGNPFTVLVGSATRPPAPAAGPARVARRKEVR